MNHKDTDRNKTVRKIECSSHDQDIWQNHSWPQLFMLFIYCLLVFENILLRRIFGHRRGEVTQEWRKIHNEELTDLYSASNIVRVIKSRTMRCEGHLTRMVEKRGVYRVLVGKPEGKRPLGKPRNRWEDTIKKDLQEVGCGAWTGSSWLRIGTDGRHL